MKPYLAIGLAFVLLAHSPLAYSGSPCSNDNAYPEVSALQIVDGRLVAILGSHFAERQSTTRPDGSEGYIWMHPRLSMYENDKWQVGEFAKANEWVDRSNQECLVVPKDAEGAWNATYPGIPFSEVSASSYDQSITSCATDGQNLWGGISFYGGEGYWGAGRLAKKDLETDSVEFVSLLPRTVNSQSLGPLAYFADTLWMGTFWNGECGGPAPGGGVRRLKQSPYLDYGVAESVPEVCGFAVRDFQVFEDALWVATELGLSKLVDEDGPVWTNFVPDLDEPNLFRELSCDELYVELLSSDDFANVAGLNVGNAFDAFWRRLSKLRPEFTTRYLRKLHGHATDDYPKGYE